MKKNSTYDMIARAFENAKLCNHTIEMLAFNIAAALKEDNKYFDQDRFIEACKLDLKK